MALGICIVNVFYSTTVDNISTFDMTVYLNQLINFEPLKKIAEYLL